MARAYSVSAETLVAEMQEGAQHVLGDPRRGEVICRLIVEDCAVLLDRMARERRERVSFCGMPSYVMEVHDV